MSTHSRTSAFLTDDDWEVLARVCKESGVSPDLVEQMIVAENKVYGMGRRHGIHEVLAELINDAIASAESKKGGAQ